MLSKFVNWFKASVVIPMLFFNYCYADVETKSQINVTDSKLLKSDKQSDGWHVVILAKIEKDVLKEEIQNSDPQKQTFSFDASNEVAKKLTLEEKGKNAVDVISSISRLDIRDALIYRSELRKEKVDNKNVNYVRHYIGLDVKKYLGKIDQLSKILEKVAVSKKSFYFNNDALKANKVAMNFNTMFDSVKNMKFSNRFDDGFFYNPKAFKGLSNSEDFHQNTKFDEEHCVVMVNSPSKLTVYCFDGNIKESINCLLPKTLDLVFKVENTDGDIVAISNNINLYSAIIGGSTARITGTSYGTINLFTPYLKLVNRSYSSDGFEGFLAKFDQIVELSDEELLNTKQLSASYEITGDHELDNSFKCEK